VLKTADSCPGPALRSKAITRVRGDYLGAVPRRLDAGLLDLRLAFEQHIAPFLISTDARVNRRGVLATGL